MKEHAFLSKYSCHLEYLISTYKTNLNLHPKKMTKCIIDCLVPCTRSEELALLLPGASSEFLGETSSSRSH